MRLRLLVRVATIPLLAHCSSSLPPPDGGSDAAPDQSTDARPDVSDGAADVVQDVVNDADATDVVDASPLCDPNKPFDPPVEITELTGIGNYLGPPRLTPDELTLYSTAAYNGKDAGLAWTGGDDIIVATRTSMTAPFSNVACVSSLNTTSNEEHLTVSGDNLMLIYDDGNGNMSASTRAKTTDPFGTPTSFYVTASEIEWYAYLLPNKLALYYAHTGNFQDIARATRATASDPFALDTTNAFLNVNQGYASQASPAVTSDELTLYFARDANNNNGYDIYVSTRPDTKSSFSKPTVFPFNSSFADRPGFISDDLCRLYFASDRDGPSKLYLAKRPL